MHYTPQRHNARFHRSSPSQTESATSTSDGVTDSAAYSTSTITPPELPGWNFRHLHCHEWNTAVHVQDAEGDPRKRAFTRDELQALFDYTDDQVTVIRAAGRKGWLAAFRNAALFKVAYGYGLRRTETAMLDLADFGANPHAPEFGELGSATSGTARR